MEPSAARTRCAWISDACQFQRCGRRAWVLPVQRIAVAMGSAIVEATVTAMLALAASPARGMDLEDPRTVDQPQIQMVCWK